MGVGGDLENAGTVTGHKDAATHLTVDGLFTNSGTLAFNNGGSVLTINGAGSSVNSGDIADNGSLVLGSGADLSNTALLTVGSGDTPTGVTMGSSAALRNSGTAAIYGNIVAATDADGNYLDSQTIDNTSSLTVTGATILGANAAILNTLSATPASDAALTLKSDLTLGSGATFTNSGYHDDGINAFQSVAAISGDLNATSADIVNKDGARLDIRGILALGDASFENTASSGTYPAAQATLGGLSAGAGSLVDNGGEMIVNGAVTLTGADGDAARLDNTGNLTVTGTSTLHRYSVFNNAGTADMNGNVAASAPSPGDTASTVILANSGRLNMNGGTLDLSHVTNADQTGSGVINIMGGAHCSPAAVSCPGWWTTTAAATPRNSLFPARPQPPEPFCSRTTLNSPRICWPQLPPTTKSP